MSSFKFTQKEVASKDFHNQRQVTDMFTISINKILVFDKVAWNNGEDWMGETT